MIIITVAYYVLILSVHRAKIFVLIYKMRLHVSM